MTSTLTQSGFVREHSSYKNAEHWATTAPEDYGDWILIFDHEGPIELVHEDITKFTTYTN